MPDNFESLEAFIDNNDVEHVHLNFELAQQMYKATRELGLMAMDRILELQKITLSCQMCSVVLAESSPVFHAVTVPMGRYKTH